MDGEGLSNGCVDVVFMQLLGEVLLHWEGTPRDDEDRHFAEKVGEALGVHGGACNDQFNVTTLLGYFAQNTKEDISVERTFMSFVHDHCTVLV